MSRSASSVTALLVAGALALATPASAMADVPASPAAVTAGSGPVSVAVVIPLTVPSTTSGLLDADALTTYTQAGGLLARQLDAVAGTAAAIGLDPMIVASIRVLGSSAPQSSLDFLARLHGLSNEVFLLGYADADPALASVAGIQDQLSPLGFDFAIDADDFGPAATPTETPEPTPTATPEPAGKPPLPTTEDLLAWPSTLPSIAWPAEGTVDKRGLAGLVGLGYQDALLSSTNVSGTVSALADLGDIDGLITDDPLSAAVREAV